MTLYLERGIALNLDSETLKNEDYRRVVYTTPEGDMQLVLQSLMPGENIPREIHHHNTQFFKVEAGRIKIIIGEDTVIGGTGSAFMVNPNTWHYVVNESPTEPLKLYTIYDGTVHPRGLIQRRQPRKET